MLRPLAGTLLVLAACAVSDPSASEPPGSEPACAAFAGAATWEGHFRRPHETHTIDAGLAVFRDGDRARVELSETWNPARAPSRTVFVRDANGCYVQEPGNARFVRDDGDGERLVRLVLGATRSGERRECTIARQHPRLGDIEDRARWESTADGETLRISWHRAHDTAELALRAVAAPAALDHDTAFAVGEVSGEPGGGAPRPAAARFATLAPGVHELVLADADTRSLVVEFADHVVLCETSVDNGAGERLLAALAEHVPGKPVRYVLFGHYHPHYTGGLRAVLARGATVVAPPLGAAYAREIAARPFRSPPDAFAAGGRAANVEPFTGERVFRDDTNELVAIDIGADSHHTDEYVVFHLPRQRLLFQGDLGWFGAGNGLRGGGERARGLLHAIDERHLDVSTLVQGWPTVGRSTVSLDELRALLAK